MKEKTLKIFSIICFARIILLMILAIAGYMYTFRFFEPHRIFVYILTVVEIIALTQIDRPSTRILLILALVYPTDIFIIYLVTIISIITVIAIKNKKRLMSLVIISVCISLIFGFVCFLPFGEFITHTSYAVYNDIDTKYTVVVQEEYSFTDIKQCYITVCEGGTLDVLGHKFYKRNGNMETVKVYAEDGRTPNVSCENGKFIVADTEYVIK